MAFPLLAALGGLATTVVQSIGEHVKQRQALKRTVMENRMRLAASENQCNHEWEMKQLENAGWKDDVLFFAWIGFFIWSGFFPEDSARVMTAWESLPEWFLRITFWIVAAVLGVKKVGDYLPGMVRGVASAIKGGGDES